MSGTLTESGPSARRGGRSARLILALQADHPRAGGVSTELAGSDEVRLGRGDTFGVERRTEEAGDLLAITVPDARMSADHARLTRMGGRWLLEDRGSKNGTRVGGVLEKRVFLEDGDVIETGHSFLVFREGLAPEEEDGEGGGGAPASAAAASPAFATLVPSLARAFARLAAIARAEVAVVLRGESGSGKEMLAQAVHALSGRPGRFVAVNCGAIPEALVPSELFGHRKGAFSGATEDRPGHVRAADRGTLLLDEIADLPAGAQAALLRVLQERQVTPLGSATPLAVDLRVVTASHQDLEALVAKGAFREDLLARLSGFVFDLPPLRTRREDLGLLVAALLARLRPRSDEPVALAVDAARALCLHAWPRNVRELEQALASALALAPGGRIGLSHLPPAVQGALAPPAAPGDALGDDAPAEDVALREELTAQVRKHAGNLSAVARELRKDRKQIQRWLKRLGIDPDRYRL